MANPSGQWWPGPLLLRRTMLLVVLLASAAGSEAKEYTVNGVAYNIAAIDGDLPATPSQSSVWGTLTGTPWFGNPALADALAALVKDDLGVFQLGSGALPPAFIYDNLANGYFYDLTILSTVTFLFAALGPFKFAVLENDPLEPWRAFDPITSSVVWVPQAGLDCRSTCSNAYMLAVSAFKPTNAMPNPPLLCAHIGTLLNYPTLTVPGSLADDAYRFYLSEGYTQPITANKTSGRPAGYDPRGCSSYLEGTAPNAQDYLCGCIPPRKSVNGDPQKPWRWVPASTDTCNSGDVAFNGYFVPFVCRVRASGLIGHLNTQNCGFPSAEEIADCAFGQKNKQPASRFPAALNMPTANPDFPSCVYVTRTGVAGTSQEVANWNSIDKLCIVSSFKYFVYRWAKQGVRPN